MTEQDKLKDYLERNPYWALWNPNIKPKYTVYKYRAYIPTTDSYVFSSYRKKSIFNLPFNQLVHLIQRKAFKQFLIQGEKKSLLSVWKL